MSFGFWGKAGRCREFCFTLGEMALSAEIARKFGAYFVQINLKNFEFCRQNYSTGQDRAQNQYRNAEFRKGLAC